MGDATGKVNHATGGSTAAITANPSKASVSVRFFAYECVHGDCGPFATWSHYL